MKTILVLVTILGMSAADCRRSGISSWSNSETFDIYNMIPFEKIKAIIKKYTDMADPAIMNVQEFLHSSDFKEVWNMSLTDPFVKKVIKVLQRNGVDVRKLINTFSELIEIPPLPLARSAALPSGQSTSSRLRSMVKEIFRVIPLKDIMSRVTNLRPDSPTFKRLLIVILSKDFRASVERILAYPQVQDFIESLKKNGVPVNKYANILKTYLEWE